MKPVSKEILGFLESRNDIYLNRESVEFVYFPDGSICFAASLPGTADNNSYDLDLTLETDTIDKLVDILQISTLQQCKTLTPTYLLNLYHQGKVLINCTIEREPIYYTLDFLKIGSKVWAVDKDGDGRLISNPLEKPEEFYEYLKKHARHNHLFF